MEVLQTLAVAFGLAGLSGYSLYLTVLATGLAIRFEWIHLAPQFASLSVLANPAILIAAGLLFLIEFIVDKIPWADSIWDAIHTVIRPIGGALLAVQALGNPNPVFDVIVGLLAGSIAFVGHSVKAGSRLVVNQSPEPFSNIAVSSAENVLVAAGLFLLWKYPLVALALLILFVAAALYFLPKTWRATCIRLWFILHKLNQPARNGANQALPAKLPASYEAIFRELYNPPPRLAWAVRCVSGKGKQIDRNRFGFLAASEDAKIFFITKGWLKHRGKLFEIEDFDVSFEPRFLYDELHLASAGKEAQYTFKFDRSRSNMVTKIVAYLKERLSGPRTLTVSSGTITPRHPAA